jgi:hypothetical protein
LAVIDPAVTIGTIGTFSVKLGANATLFCTLEDLRQAKS